MTDRLERNKKNVLAFYDLMFNQCKTAEAFEKYAGDVYIQHNQSVADGAEPVIEHFKGMEEVYPGKRAHFVRVIAEGNYVVVHVRTEWPGERDGASADIFRLDDHGKIVEHWDVLQVVPEQSANNNTMF